MAAFMVDVTRLAVYGLGPLRETLAGGTAQDSLGVVGAAIAAAFVGTYLSSRFLKKVTVEAIRKLVGVLLALLSLALAFGLA